MFQLDPTLAKDTLHVGDFPLSSLLLSRDANYPWCILVPRLEGLTELHQLTDRDALQWLRESRHLSSVMMELFRGDKLNVAALGNMVPQLHIHHIVRYRNDAAWPEPVWGKVPVRAYERGELVGRAERLLSRLKEGFIAATLD